MQDSSPTLLFCAGPALGHVTRLLPVAEAIRARQDCRILFSLPAHSDHAGVIRAAGFDVAAIPSSTQRMPDLQSYPAKLEELMAREQPDLIMCDKNMLLWGSAVAWPDVPRVLISNAFLLAPGDRETEQAANFPLVAERVNAARTQKGLPPATRYQDFYAADLVCLADPTPLARAAARPDHGVMACGACYLSLPGNLPAPLVDMDDILLLSMGSTGRHLPDETLLRDIAGRCGAKHIVYAGSGAGRARTYDCIDYAGRDIPLAKLLPRVRCAVTQGGAGSSYLALAHGVPVVTLPTHRNHDILGRILQEHWVGLCLSRGAEQEALGHADFGDMAAQAKAFADQMSTEDGPATIANQVLALLADDQTPKPSGRVTPPPAPTTITRTFNHAPTDRPLETYPPHSFALQWTLSFYRQKTVATAIPKNGCSNLRFTAAVENGCAEGPDNIDWIHANNQTFMAGSGAEAAQAHYTFVVLRCPYARLVSAFMDKLVNMDIQSWRLRRQSGRRLHPHELTFRQFVNEIADTPRTDMDVHWRPQSDFLLFHEYDDYFNLENFAYAVEKIEARTGIKVIDTRSHLGHHASATEDAEFGPRAADIPALDLLVAKKAGHVPRPSDLFDSTIATRLRELYAQDVALYQSKFGKSPLIKRFA